MPPSQLNDPVELQELSRLGPPHEAVDLSELYQSTIRNRTTFTTVRSRYRDQPQDNRLGSDFLTLITLMCDIYRAYGGELVVMQSFHPDSESFEDRGHSCIVNRRAIATPTPSNITRGKTDNLEENIIVKRTRQGILEPESSALRSFIAELRVRAHLPLRHHPNIVDLKGVAWDFGDDERKKPCSLLLEELAVERSLSHFWDKRTLTRMPFKAKADLCLDIAQGLSALHSCGIVHGDMKPDNVLIFPRPGSRDAFMAKLTDFGHSVFSYECPTWLPAFTLQYSAPEANGSGKLTFSEMKQTDVYSYGLVVLSVVIGRSYSAGFSENLESFKKDDSLLDRAVKLVEQEDRDNTDSDFDLVTLRPLFTHTIQRDSGKRDLARCIQVVKRLIKTQLFIGYQTLSRCSYLLKEKIVQDLHTLALNQADPRKPAACWELSVCYFVGFGIKRDFKNSCHWLAEAAKQGVTGAQAFFLRMHKAMDMDLYETLRAHRQEPSADSAPETTPSSDADVISQWLFDAVESGYSEILPDLQLQDPERYKAAREILSIRLATEVPMDAHGLSLVMEVSDPTLASSASSPITQRIAAAAASCDLPLLQRLANEVPESINFQDESGNTALIHAARCGRYEVLDLLLDQPNADASICNLGQQTALHFLSIFTDQEIENLVPRLIDSKADIDQETALHVSSSWGEAPDLKPRIRCCPLLQAILCNSLVLLKSLLIALHPPASGPMRCRVCETGSRYRKMVAIAIMLHRSEMVEALLEHLRVNAAGKGTDLNLIEVWYNQELLPVWKLTIRGLPVGVADLPESFCRALSYGKDGVAALHKTLEILWRFEDAFLPKAYNQLQQAAVSGNVDAIDFLIEKTQRQKPMPHSWWVSEDVYGDPLTLSIRLGFRDVFEKIWSLDDTIFDRSFTFELCSLYRCRTCPKPFNYSIPGRLMAWLLRVGRKRHEVNLAQISLSAAVVAAHQDGFFVSFILDHTSSPQILHTPSESDERISNQPTTYLAQAILVDSFWAADLILQRYPKTLGQSVRVIPPYLRNRRPAGALLPWESNLIRSEVLPESFPLIHYILLIGSYKHCAYLLRILQETGRSSAKGHRLSIRRQRRTATVTSEAGLGGWDSLRLQHQEYHFLLDRAALWGVVSSQVAQGHSTDWYYLRLALFYANKRAVEELLERGWNANGPIWACFITPLMLAKRLLATGADCILPTPAGARKIRYGPHGVPHGSSIGKWEKRYAAGRPSNLEANVNTLERKGGYVPRIYKFQYVLWGLYYLFYVVALPLALGSNPKIGIGWAYGYVGVALTLPPVPVLFLARYLWNQPGSSYSFSVVLLIAVYDFIVLVYGFGVHLPILPSSTEVVERGHHTKINVT
ncbi:hypothetical protein FGG08_004256 [Glutinoglossum americanum]|uniref:Protein kinase domain-containing protein n=1 Tax=Glutinoglossum americanum TaxID=1670608 RepID=A0A9P8L434_9PEZI|nr:hypothetical protein FGG08_004256 [Glutinoglossum americanum]